MSAEARLESDINGELGEVRPIAGEHSRVFDQVQSAGDVVWLIESLNKIISFDMRSKTGIATPAAASVVAISLHSVTKSDEGE
jgi:hypothetical protein